MESKTVLVVEGSPDLSAPEDAHLLAAFKEHRGLIDQLRVSGWRFFFLRWHGDRVPHGAVLEGRTVAFAGNGQVDDHNHLHIGTYVRIVDPENETSDEHAMLVFLPPTR